MNHCGYSYYGVLPSTVVDSIVEKCLKEKLEKGTIGTKDGDVVDESFRISNIKLLDIAKYEELFQTIWRYALNANRYAYGFDIANVENCQFSVYDSKDKAKYDWHIDTIWGNPSTFDRKISLIIQLSDPSEYEGGQFQVKGVFESEEEKELMNKKGTIITIPSFVEHRVTPVTKGRRLSLIAWIEGTKFR